MKTTSFPSLLCLLLVTLCIAVDGHDNLRGSNNYYKGSREFNLQPRMLGKECTRNHPSPNARGRNPSNQAHRRNRRPASRTRDVVPSSFKPFKNIFASNSRRTTTFLKVETQGPETAGVDQEFDFITTVSNAEDCWMATDVVVLDDLPTEGSFLSCEPNGTIENSTLSVDLHDLVPGETAQVILHWRAPSTEGMVINHACADALNAEETPDAEAIVHVVPDVDPVCNTSTFETQVYVNFTVGTTDDANLTQEDINLIEESFVSSYNNLTEKHEFCDPFFRHLTKAEVLVNSTDVSGDGRFLQPESREYRMKVTGRCRGNECDRSDLFKRKSRGRDQGRRLENSTNLCKCPPDAKEEREPTQEEFAKDYDETISKSPFSFCQRMELFSTMGKEVRNGDGRFLLPQETYLTLKVKGRCRGFG